MSMPEVAQSWVSRKNWLWVADFERHEALLDGAVMKRTPPVALPGIALMMQVSQNGT